MLKPASVLAALLLGPVLAMASPDGAETRPRPPAPPASGFGSDRTPFARASEQVIDNPVSPGHKVHLFRPEGPPAGEPLPARLPVVFFAHGFGAGSPDPYRAWLQHIAREGALVVYPVYPGLEGGTRPSRYDVLWAGLEAGIAALSSGDGPKPDVARMGFLGHSFGGGAAPAVAARAAARGYGAEALWIESFAPWYDLDRAAWASLPAKALLLAVAYCDDRVCDPSTAASFVAEATTIPADRKALVVFRSDEHGSPALRADHMAPLTFPDADALDAWGTWRLDDALRAYAIGGSAEAKAFAFGTDPATRSLGTWSDGAPVAPPAVGEVPEAGKGKRRYLAGGAAERMGRGIGAHEPYSGLPLPSPEKTPASRLPLAERLRRPAPAGPLPPEVAEAVAKGRLLVEVVKDAKGRTASALEAAAASLAAKGIAVLRVAPDSPLAKALKAEGDILDPAADPSAILFAKGGELLLWKEGEEPHLVPAILDLAR